MIPGLWAGSGIANAQATLEQVVVTAQKREQSLQDAPRAVSAMTGEAMRDVDRIEILRGPQSTLYGENTTARVVAIYTQAPAESFEGNAQLAAGLAQFCSSHDPLDQKHCPRTPQTTDLKSSEITLLADYALQNDWTITSTSSWDWFKFKGTQDDVVQATWNITEKIAVTGGLRWQKEEKRASLEQGVTVPGLSLMPANLLPAGVGGDLDRTTCEVNWSVTPQYFISEDMTVYATAAHGFKSGGFIVGWGTIPMNQHQFPDESIMHYETGFKATRLDDRMQVALNVFYTEYDDYQDAAFIGQRFSVGNAEKADHKGAEAEGKLLFGENVSTDFGISFADLTYDKYTNG